VRNGREKGGNSEKRRAGRVRGSIGYIEELWKRRREEEEERDIFSKNKKRSPGEGEREMREEGKELRGERRE